MNKGTEVMSLANTKQAQEQDQECNSKDSPNEKQFRLLRHNYPNTFFKKAR